MKSFLALRRVCKWFNKTIDNHPYFSTSANDASRSSNAPPSLSYLLNRHPEQHTFTINLYNEAAAINFVEHPLFDEFKKKNLTIYIKLNKKNSPKFLKNYLEKSKLYLKTNPPVKLGILYRGSPDSYPTRIISWNNRERDLDIHHTTKYKGNGKKILNVFGDVKKLSVDCENFKFNSLKNLLSLRTLICILQNNFTDKTLETIGDGLKNLEDLRLVYCPNFGGNGLEKLKKLQHFLMESQINGSIDMKLTRPPGADSIPVVLDIKDGIDHFRCTFLCKALQSRLIAANLSRLLKQRKIENSQKYLRNETLENLTFSML